MSENTTQTAAQPLPEEIAAAFGKLEANPAYAPVVPMLVGKFSDHYALVRTNNSNVARINEARNTDPESTEYQDSTWKRVVAEGGDAAMAKKEARYQKLIAEAEKLLAELRNDAKAHMQPALSEEQVTALRKQVNDGKKVIEDSVKATASVADMADQMLTLAGAAIEGGIWSLMPQPDSLMNARGRKSTGNAAKAGGYATRLVEAKIDGKSANRDVKRKGKDVNAAHFNYVAEDLSKEFNDKAFPENQVSAEDVEKAYYASKGVEFRDSESMPEVHEFEFTRTIKVQNPNDDSATEIPVTKRIEVTRWTKNTAGLNDDNAEESGDNNSADNDSAENAENAETAETASK